MQSFRRAIYTLSAVLLFPGLVFAGPVDINSADAATLTKELVGVGATKAQAIVAFRSKNGPFTKPSDLLKVKGIGVRILEDNRHNIKIDSKAAKKAANKKS